MSSLKDLRNSLEQEIEHIKKIAQKEGDELIKRVMLKTRDRRNLEGCFKRLASIAIR